MSRYKLMDDFFAALRNAKATNEEAPPEGEREVFRQLVEQASARSIYHEQTRSFLNGKADNQER